MKLEEAVRDERFVPSAFVALKAKGKSNEEALHALGIVESTNETTQIRRLDAGCGGGPKRPAKDFDAYTDVLDPSKVSVRPYFQCPLEDMSCFDDDEFDWVRAHHSIEHCTDPDKACAEIQRIGKAGIISFPPMQAEIMFGRKDHNWFCVVDRGRLLFIKKRHASYGVPRSVTRCELNVNFTWKDSFEYQVVR